MMSEHQSLLKKALFVLSSRIKLSSKSQPGFQELLKYAIVVSFHRFFLYFFIFLLHFVNADVTI